MKGAVDRVKDCIDRGEEFLPEFSYVFDQFRADGSITDNEVNRAWKEFGTRTNSKKLVLHRNLAGTLIRAMRSTSACTWQRVDECLHELEGQLSAFEAA